MSAAAKRLRLTLICASALILTLMGAPAAHAAVVQVDADLAITKVLNGSNPDIGAPAVFTVTLTNNGPAAATGITVGDLLPSGLTFVSATPSLGSYTPATGLWDVGSLAAGGSATLQLTATRTAASALTNTATVTASAPQDPNAADNTASVTLAAVSADLAVTKTVSDPNALPGENVVFTVTLTNNGPFGAGGTAVTDLLPSGLTFVSATPSQGTYGSSTGFWVVGSLASGASATLQLTATRTVASALTNTATVTGSDHPDLDPTNNTASASLATELADLAVTKVVTDPSPDPGDQVTFTVTLTNDGPDSATGVLVSDPLPAGLTLIAATPSQGTYDTATGSWHVGPLTSGATATLQLTAQVTGTGTLTNTATATASEPDPDPTNNAASATVTVTGAPASPTPGPGLPPTGFGATGLIGAGLLLVLGGALSVAVVAMLRRRGHRMTG